MPDGELAIWSFVGSQEGDSTDPLFQRYIDNFLGFAFINDLHVLVVVDVLERREDDEAQAQALCIHEVPRRGSSLNARNQFLDADMTGGPYLTVKSSTRIGSMILPHFIGPSWNACGMYGNNVTYKAHPRSTAPFHTSSEDNILVLKLHMSTRHSSISTAGIGNALLCVPVLTVKKHISSISHVVDRRIDIPWENWGIQGSQLIMLDTDDQLLDCAINGS
jgi:hypothetical protein